jgi:hypothetical protein
MNASLIVLIKDLTLGLERLLWVPLAKLSHIVTPAKAGVQVLSIYWIPAFAGMTEKTLKKLLQKTHRLFSF